MKELTREQAIALGESEFWKTMTPRDIADFQLNTRLLCMPFEIFHEAVEVALGRPVFTHEFAYSDNLRAELYGDKSAPTFEEIMSLIPADKQIVIVVDK